MIVDFAGEDLFGELDKSYEAGSWCFGVGERMIVGDYDGDGFDDLLCHHVTTGVARFVTPYKRVDYFKELKPPACAAPGDDLH